MFISDTLSKILLSKSTYANMLLGYFLNYVIENNEDLDMDYLIVIYALHNLYDKDVINFKKIYSINSRSFTTVNSGLKMLFYGDLKMSFFGGLRMTYV
ncbi:hypothetical protein B5P37_03005 [Staphylococcus lutrae]|uniref:Uncharacterized protein n=2 Tax=Staphylococcus lutrae TaxID=155085 RepID=A0AAC9RSC7_9STAP|nr:hypothetical protein B5P37_03005 [Staphylococcus lutrae]